MAVGPIVLGFCILTTQGNSGPSCDAPDPGGNDLHWTSASVPYKFNDGGSADMGAEVYPALDAAFQSWNAVSGVGYSYAGCTSKGRGSVIDGSGDASPDGSSIVTWIESSWPYSVGAIAITWTYFFEDGTIDEADMLMNGEDYDWTTSTAGANTDVQSITAHESGHYIGLGHTTDALATMYGTVEAGETLKRSLNADDSAGAAFLYGGTPSSGSTFDGECVGGGGSGSGEGCACSLDRTGAPRPGLLAGILSVVALLLFGMMRLRASPALRLAPSLRVSAVALALFAARDASATTMMNLSLEQLAAESQSVVHGDVTSVETLTDGKIIWTVQRLNVKSVLAGLTVGDTIELVTPGGTLPAGVRGPRGLHGAKAVGVPTFRVGQEVVVFVAPSRGERPFLTVPAFQQGVFTVKRDSKGTATAVRDVSGLARMERTEEGLVAVEGDALASLPLETLFARIRVLPTRVSPR